MSKPRRKFYVVWAGRQPGIYDSWEECQEQINGFENARYKSFNTLEDATRAFREADAKNAVEFIRALVRRQSQGPINLNDFPEIDKDAICVDASTPSNPGPVEYRGVVLATGKEIFRIGPLEGGSNNIGEFLAIVHALALLKQHGMSNAIYSDSKTAILWVTRKSFRSTIARTDRNARLFNLVDRAIAWLNTNSYPNAILKWDTNNWGEIPADFGRK